MNKLIEKRHLNPTVTLFTFEAPLIAKKAEPGQFVILRPNENSERIPLTIADFDREKGTVTVRDRDTMQQITVNVDEVENFLREKLAY